MKRLSIEEVHALKVTELGLEPTALDLVSTEALAAALRRAAGFLCPCSSQTLIRAVVRPLDALVADLEIVRNAVEELLEAMVAHGDLMEQREVVREADARAVTLLYVAPPSFVSRSSGAALVLGVVPDQLSCLPGHLERRIEYANHVRRLPAEPAEDLRAELIQLGLIELPVEAWLKAPRVETPVEHLERIDRLLEAAPPATSIPGLTLLDPTLAVRYYRGRWIAPKAKSGRFVARRAQAYGADLWCYLEMLEGLCVL